MHCSTNGGLKSSTYLTLGPWALLSIIFFLSCICYLNFPLGYNQNIYHYMGTVIRDGGAPYRDFVDRKGPVGLLVYSLAAVLFGASELAYRIFDGLILAGIGVCLYKFNRQSFSPLAAVGGVALWFAHTLLDGPGNTGDVTNLIVLGVLAAAILVEVPSRVRLFAVGFVTAAIGWVKPTAWLIVGPMLVYELWFIKDERESRGKFLAFTIFGFFLFCGWIIAYLYFTNALAYFYEAVVLDPLLAYVPKTQFVVGHNVRGFSQWLLGDPIFRIGGLFGLFVGKSKNRTIMIARLVIFGGLLAVFVESRFWPYHFAPILPFLSFGILVGLQRAFEFFSKKNSPKTNRAKRGSFAIGFLLLFVPPLLLAGKDLRMIYSSGPNSAKRAGLFVSAEWAKIYRDRLQVVQTLRPLLCREDEVYVLGSDPGIYLALQKRTACRHANPGDLLYDYANVNNPAHRQRWRAEILDYLKNHQPDWLIVDQNLWKHLDAEAKKALTQVIEKFYESPECIASYWLYHKI